MTEPTDAQLALHTEARMLWEELVRISAAGLSSTPKPAEQGAGPTYIQILDRFVLLVLQLYEAHDASRLPNPSAYFSLLEWERAHDMPDYDGSRGAT